MLDEMKEELEKEHRIRSEKCVASWMQRYAQVESELDDVRQDRKEMKEELNRELVATCNEDVVLARARVFIKTNGWKYLTHNGYVKV